MSVLVCSHRMVEAGLPIVKGREVQSVYEPCRYLCALFTSCYVICLDPLYVLYMVLRFHPTCVGPVFETITLVKRDLASIPAVQQRIHVCCESEVGVREGRRVSRVLSLPG